MIKTIYPVTPQAVANAKRQVDEMYTNFINNKKAKKKKPKLEFGEEDLKRTNPQNNLQHKWYAEMAQQDEMGMTALDYRCFCKLHFGLPILCENLEQSRLIHEKIYKQPYETQIDFMGKPPFGEFEVTRHMTKTQKQRFLNEIYDYWTIENGYRLTQPAERGICME